jgi:class 3 adenylate cyclase
VVQIGQIPTGPIVQFDLRQRQSARVAVKRKKLTIFLSDIANFIETIDSIESEELTNLLNQYLTEMSRIAISHGRHDRQVRGRRDYGVLWRSNEPREQGGRHRVRQDGNRYAAAVAVIRLQRPIAGRTV